MNTLTPETIRSEENEALLSLVVTPALVDPLIEWLLEQPEVVGFISQPVNGHGGAEHVMTPAERVAGYRNGWLVQTHMPENKACELLERLKNDFRGSEVHYWLVPLTAGGHLAP